MLWVLKRTEKVLLITQTHVLNLWIKDNNHTFTLKPCVNRDIHFMKLSRNYPKTLALKSILTFLTF